jgi:hypothetical protein
MVIYHHITYDLNHNSKIHAPYIYSLLMNSTLTFLYFFPLIFLSFFIPLFLPFLSFSLFHQSPKYSVHIFFENHAESFSSVTKIFLLRYTVWSIIQNEIKKKAIHIQACQITLHVSFSFYSHIKQFPFIMLPFSITLHSRNQRILPRKTCICLIQVLFQTSFSALSICHPIYA